MQSALVQVAHLYTIHAESVLAGLGPYKFQAQLDSFSLYSIL